MNYYATYNAYSTTGVKTITCGFQPKMMRITLGQKYATAQGFAHLSIGTGWIDSSTYFQWYDSIFQDTAGGKTVSGSDKIASHWERVSGTLTEKIAATIDSFTATAGKINVTTTDVNYTWFIELMG